MGSDPVHFTQPHIDVSLLPRCHRRDEDQNSGAIINISSDIAFSESENRAAYAAASVSGRLTPTLNGKPQLKESPSAMPENRRTSPKPWLSSRAMPADT
jgi:hypothetical protein